MSGTFKVNVPLWFVTVPVVVPLMTTVAPTRGWFSVSLTRPSTLFCAKTETEIRIKSIEIIPGLNVFVSKSFSGFFVCGFIRILIDFGLLTKVYRFHHLYFIGIFEKEAELFRER